MFFLYFLHVISIITSVLECFDPLVFPDISLYIEINNLV